MRSTGKTGGWRSSAPSGAYVGQFNGSAAPAGAFSWPSTVGGIGYSGGHTGPEGGIAIDNSSNPLDPSKGDVYVLNSTAAHPSESVVEKFSASGTYIGEIVDPKEGLPPTGVAVDPSGTLWVTHTYSKYVQQFNDAAPINEHVSSLLMHLHEENQENGEIGYVGLALDAEGHVYLGVRLTSIGALTFPTVFSTAGELLVERLDSEETTGLAVDESSDDAYVDHGTSVVAYSPSHIGVERFGVGKLEASEGIAVDSRTGTVFAANAGSQTIDVFTAFVVPDVTTGSVSNLAETSATVGGVVNPDGLPVTSCVFEYGTSSSYGQSVPCSSSPGSGSSPVAVGAQLSGLERLTTYHYRLRVSNANGSDDGQDRTFVTPAPVALSEEFVTDVSSTSALFSVQIDPGGADTTYSFEYGPSEAYGESVPVPAGDAGPGTVSVPVAVRVEGLLGASTYHVRAVASNLLGTVYGPDQTFTTQTGGGEFVLPDGREWELVSPVQEEGSLILPIGKENGSWNSMIEASADGSAISYSALDPLGANPQGNSVPFGLTQVLSTRGGGGWSSQDISTPHQAAEEDDTETEYIFFSSDLSRALVEPGGETPLSPEATETTPYVRDDSSGSYTPLLTAGDVIPGAKFGPPQRLKFGNEDAKVVAVTPDLSHVLFLSLYALTSNAVQATQRSNLYEWSEGRLQLVNVLPDGTANPGEAALGGGTGVGQNTRNAFSSDGSRVFFTLGSKELYMRDTVTGKTLKMPIPAGDLDTEFQIASADGSKVFYMGESEKDVAEKDLYVCQIVEEGGEPKCDVTDLTPNAGKSAEVRSLVMGASEDGSIVYFVAHAKLAEGAEAGKENLYVESETGSSWSAPRLVAILSEEDSFDWDGGNKVNISNDGEMTHLTSRVSPSGRYLTFETERSLTGYDNRDAVYGQPDTEVFLYDEATGRLRCVSCNPTGARPDGVSDGGGLLVDTLDLWGGIGGRLLAASIPGWTQTAGTHRVVGVLSVPDSLR